jgi:hypothetical protein
VKKTFSDCSKSPCTLSQAGEVLYPNEEVNEEKDEKEKY